jgi:hypothetical protein
VFRLGPDLLLWQLPCHFGPNQLDQLVLADRRGRGPRLAQLPNPPTNRDHDPETLVFNAVIDPAAGVVSSFMWGDPLRDCGTANDWVWTGRRFELLRQRWLEACRGVPVDDWPLTWRARIR